MKVELEGKVVRVGDLAEFSQGFSKRELVVDIDEGGDGEHSQPVPVEFIKERADMIDEVGKGDLVKITAYMRGSYWEKGDRYFLSLSGYSCDVELKKPKDGPAADNPQPTVEEAAADFPF